MMPGTPFDVRRETQHGDTVLILSGDVTRTAQDALQAAYASAKEGPGRLLLDFTGTDYINSTGIALIVGILADCRAAGRTVGAFGLTDHYREIFAITRLADFMSIYEDADAAGVA
jgi:anti-sigma B factor antagonist